MLLAHVHRRVTSLTWKRWSGSWSVSPGFSATALQPPTTARSRATRALVRHALTSPLCFCVMPFACSLRSHHLASASPPLTPGGCTRGDCPVKRCPDECGRAPVPPWRPALHGTSGARRDPSRAWATPGYSGAGCVASCVGAGRRAPGKLFTRARRRPRGAALRLLSLARSAAAAAAHRQPHAGRPEGE